MDTRGCTPGRDKSSRWDFFSNLFGRPPATPGAPLAGVRLRAGSRGTPYQKLACAVLATCGRCADFQWSELLCQVGPVVHAHAVDVFFAMMILPLD